LLDADVLDVLRVLGLLDWRNHLVERKADYVAAAGIDFDLSRRAVKVTRRATPLLAFAAIHRESDGVPVGAAKGFVAMK